jgi:ABC-type Zn uptake system ZnuABC Zn-binding protein ZnuA
MPARRSWWAALAAAGLATVLGLAGCSTAEDPWKGQTGPPRVVVSFPPLANFVKNVGGGRVGVISICTDKGPHEYEYNVQDARALRSADLFLVNGLELDDKRFTNQLHENSGNAKLVYLKLGEKLDPKLLIKEGGELDPHVWLGVDQSCAMVEQIRDALAKADSAHAEEYKKNAAAFIDRLKDLHRSYAQKFDARTNRKVISFHDSMRYLAKDYDLDVVAVMELDPGEDPGPGRLRELRNTAKEKRPAAVTVEPQYNEKVVDSFVKDLAEGKDKLELKKVMVDPLETASAEELKDPDWYLNKMQANLDALLEALPGKSDK